MGGIDIGITVESLDSHFVIIPNALPRGEGEYSCLTLHERAMLTALLTLRPGTGGKWNTSRPWLDGLAPELGRDKVSKIISGLRDKRYLYTKRVHNGQGRFSWEWRVYMRQRPEDFNPFSDEPPRALPSPEKERRTTVRPTEPPTTEPPRALPSPEKERRTTVRPTEPPTTEPPRALPSPEKEAVSSALTYQPGWSENATTEAVREAITKGLPPSVAYKTIVDLAIGDTYGPTLVGPQRITSRGPWWTPGAVFIPKPEDTRPRCQVHRGEHADTCSACAGERRGREEPHKTTIAPATRAPESVRAMLASIPALRGRVTRP